MTVAKEDHYKVVIVGGGTAGISVAARLRREEMDSICIIEPSEDHYYQPLFTLVGGGVCAKEETRRSTSSVIPRGVHWVRDRVDVFDPDQNQLRTNSGKVISYEYLVVAPGIQIDWQKIEGLKETLGKNGVCSNYDTSHVEYTWETIRTFQGGHAIFTFPATPIKCAGAPQKIMYLAEHYFRRSQIREKANVVFASAVGSIFGVKKYADALTEVIKERQIETHFQHDLVKVDGEQKTATFKNLENGEMVHMKFSMLHVAPPMSAPDFIKSSPLASEAGWVDVNKHTLIHNKYKNVLSLGDASSLPTSKTGAAIRKQAPIVASHICSLIKGENPTKKYEGYTSCPLVTGYGKLILAEFDYDGNPVETFPFDQSEERYSMYLLKKHVLPQMYWHGMLKGWA